MGGGALLQAQGTLSLGACEGMGARIGPMPLPCASLTRDRIMAEAFL